MKLKQHLRKRFMYYTTEKYPSLYRPISKPYLSGDTLRKFSNHIFDESQSIDPKKVKQNDIVFLKTDLKNIYFNNYHNEIKEPYILICHNSDDSIEEEDMEFIDSKIIYLFAQKLNVPLKKNIYPLPCGLENKRFRANGKIENFNKVLEGQKNLSRKQKVFCSFNIHTNFETRKALLDQVSTDSKVDTKKFESNFAYLNALSSYKYNLCPEGNNFESHRIWESLVFGVTPIVINNNVNNNLFKAGVPLLILNEWNELDNLSIKELDKINEVNAKKNYRQFVLFDHWKKIINSKKI